MKRLLATLFTLMSIASVTAAAQAAPADATATAAVNPLVAAAGPKKPGVVRIGLVQPRVDMGQGAANSTEALRSLIAQYLTGPNLQVVPVAAMVPMQAEAEAKQSDCDYLLYATLSQKRGGGMGFLRGAQSMTSMVPMIGMSGRTGAVVGQVAAQTAVNFAGQLASSVKAKSEVSFDYRLVSPGNTTPLVANAEKMKAQTDGQDVITPMVENAAGAITASVLKK